MGRGGTSCSLVGSSASDPVPQKWVMVSTGTRVRGRQTPPFLKQGPTSPWRLGLTQTATKCLLCAGSCTPAQQGDGAPRSLSAPMPPHVRSQPRPGAPFVVFVVLFMARDLPFHPCDPKSTKKPNQTKKQKTEKGRSFKKPNNPRARPALGRLMQGRVAQAGQDYTEKKRVGAHYRTLYSFILFLFYLLKQGLT